MYSRTSNGRASGVPSPQNIRGVPLEGNHPKQSRDERRRTVRLLHQYVPEVQARGEWPSGLGQDPDDVQEYIDRYFEKEGVSLDGEKIEKNPGLGALAKLCLNSFWGKVGQRPNLKQSQFYHETEADAFFRVLSDPTKEVQNFHIVANDTIQVEWIYKKDCQPEDNKTNIYLATGLYNYQKALYTGKHFYLPKSTDKTLSRRGLYALWITIVMCVE